MSVLKLYHGTIADFNIVDLRYAKDNKDFGKGFYLTTDINQAKQLAKRMQYNAILEGDANAKAYVYMFKIDKSRLKELNTHTFQGANISWVDYILENRYSKSSNKDYDVVIGKVADVVAKRVLNSYKAKCGNNGSKDDKMQLIRDLKPDNLTDQYCFKTDKAIKLLNNIGFARREF